MLHHFAATGQISVATDADQIDSEATELDPEWKLQFGNPSTTQNREISILLRCTIFIVTLIVLCVDVIVVFLLTYLAHADVFTAANFCKVLEPRCIKPRTGFMAFICIKKNASINCAAALNG